MSKQQMGYNSEVQDVAMRLIAASGESRTLAFEALDAAEESDFDQARKLLSEANVQIEKAHEIQTELLISEANGNQLPFSSLLAHAQDHFMTSMLAVELIARLIKIHVREGENL